MEDRTGEFTSRKECGHWCIMFLSILTICILVPALGIRNNEPVYSILHFNWNFTALGLAGGLLFGGIGSLSCVPEFIRWNKNHPLDKYINTSQKESTK